MKNLFISITTLLCLTTPFSSIAADTDSKPQKIILKPGNSYQLGNINIMCVAEDILSPAVAKECQYYGSYNNERCIYKKQTFAFEDKKCVEECQHWNTRSKRCSYATKCEFFPEQKIFIKTLCKKFNDFNKKCDETKEIPIY